MPRPIPATPYVPQGAPIAPSALPQRALAAPPAGSVAPSARRSSTASPAMAVHPITTPPQQPLTGAPAGFPATGFGARAPSRPPRPQALVVEDPSLSLPTPARRPWALIFAVLLIDIGLAVSGAWMLNRGLGGGPGGDAGSEPSPPRAR